MPDTPVSAAPQSLSLPRAGLPPLQRWPVVLETAGWKDYALLDMGRGQKLERYGRFTVVRPEPQAMGTPRLKPAVWERADAVCQIMAMPPFT